MAIARQLHIPTVIIPVLPSHFSAFGMLMSDIRHDYVRTQLVAFPKLKFDELQKIFAEMIDEATAMLAAERVSEDAMHASSAYLDLRYEGQEFSIKVPVSAEEIAAGDLQDHPRSLRLDPRSEFRARGARTSRWRWSTSACRRAASGNKMQMPAIKTGGEVAAADHPQSLPRERGSVRGLPGLFARHACSPAPRSKVRR